MTTDVTIHRYAGFFHFKDDDSISFLIGWLRANSLEFAASLERMDSENPTDRHVQWCVKMDREWPERWTKQFEKKGIMGKYLVPDKKSNTGCKHSKRWSKIDCESKGYDWNSSILYVAKDVTDPETLWVPDGINKDDVIGKFRYTEAQKCEYKKSLKAKTFFQRCCEAYEELGSPNDERRIVEMLIDNHCFGKWRYTPLNDMIMMARAILMKYHTKDQKQSLMAMYDLLSMTKAK